MKKPPYLLSAAMCLALENPGRPKSYPVGNLAKQGFMITPIRLTQKDPSANQYREYPDKWIEIVPNGRVCEHTGLKHARLYTLLGNNGIARREVRVANLRNAGASQGKTLFHLGDFLRFLDRLAAEQGSGEKQAQDSGNTL